MTLTRFGRVFALEVRSCVLIDITYMDDKGSVVRKYLKIGNKHNSNMPMNTKKKELNKFVIQKINEQKREYQNENKKCQVLRVLAMCLHQRTVKQVKTSLKNQKSK